MPMLIRRSLLLLLVAALAHVAAVDCSHAGSEDRRARRSSEMAIPDPYLDPSWPDLGDSAIAPEESDSVEEVPLEELVPDEAEREEIGRYEHDQAASAGATTVPGGGEASQESDAEDGMDLLQPDGYDDPAEW